MGLQYYDLTDTTRELMLEEIERDILDKSIYISRYLNDQGAKDWPDFLKNAAKTGRDNDLAAKLNSNGSFKLQAERRKPNGALRWQKSL